MGEWQGKKTSLSAAGIKANTFTFDIGVHFAVKRFYPIWPLTCISIMILILIYLFIYFLRST